MGMEDILRILYDIYAEQEGLEIEIEVTRKDG